MPILKNKDKEGRLILPDSKIYYKIISLVKITIGYAAVTNEPPNLNEYTKVYFLFT